MIKFKLLSNSVGGIAQWQSIRLQIERSPVQLRLPPTCFDIILFEMILLLKTVDFEMCSRFIYVLKIR